MTTAPLRVLLAAEKEAQRAAKWYEKQRPGLGAEFLASLAGSFDQVRQEPSSHARVEFIRSRQVHQVMLHRFPYLVIYEVTSDQTVVLAVAHAHRRPFYWRRRRG